MRKTLKNVAEKAGVSISVASRVLGRYGYVSQETRRKVLEIAKKIGYQPDMVARSLKTKQTYSIGVIISDITTSFFTSVVRGIEDVANQNGYNVTLCNSDEDPDKESEYLRVLYGRKVDGLVISSTGRNTAYLKRLIRADLPVVLLDRGIKDIETTEVLIDNREGAYQAVNHLIGLGHKRIGIINGIKGITTSEERFEGYKKALQKNGIPLEGTLIKYGDFRIEKGREAMEKFIKMVNPPSAVFVSNEVMTTGALLALKENNVKIPQDIALAGFDDPIWAALIEPPLTAVRQPSYSVGTIACQSLLQKIRKSNRGRPFHEEIVLKPKLIIRQSCGKNKKV